VIELLLARAARKSRVPHGDGARIALCVEGGAMRGVVSAGMVSALEELGLGQAFDAVYGSSAGAINAAYFLAGQARMGTTIYFENLNNHRFISLARPFAGRPIVDLDFLLNDIAIRTKPLDAIRVLSSPAPLTVMATDVTSATRAPLRDFEDAGALFGAMRAGATMPVVAGPPVTFRGRTYLDASLTEPIPVPTAETDGCTHALVLLTRPTETARTTTAFDRAYVLPRLRRLSPALADLYCGRGEPYAALLSCIAAGTGPSGTAAVMGIRPAPPSISKLERSADRLTAGARRGHEAVMRAFGRIPS
jgi:predicted patatin/cPLA2 family phospholipase